VIGSRPPGARPLRSVPLVAVALLASCIASNVVAPDQRLVASDLTALVWTPADPAALDGFFESVDLRGEAAASLRKIFYVFLPGGTYTGAALADAGSALTFQTLSGTWTLTPDGLVLDQGRPVRCEMAPGHLRLEDTNGVVVLRRGPLP
jgi:hypothetical protein